MKYLVVGSGGVGSSIGGFLSANGEDVTFIARGAHLDKLRNEGLRITSGIKGELNIFPVSAFKSTEYDEKADVIFVCVKSYSLSEIVPFIKKAAHKNTLVIPILNGIGNGDKIYNEFKDAFILDGCIYIVAYMKESGHIVQTGDIFKLVFGARKGQQVPLDLLNDVKVSLENSGIKAVVSIDIERDTFTKFSFISAYASCGAYYNITSKEMQQEGIYRQTFKELVAEFNNIAAAIGIDFDRDILDYNVKLLDAMDPDSTASMQKDIKAGKNTEMDGICFDVVRLSEKYGVNVPRFRVIAEKFGY
ncbi:MAG: 2-dehydropantoate 2-reductase [Bacillota bacterium]|nr:2-dehydropantoate 2-reductase [Bacillota bacterium]